MNYIIIYFITFISSLYIVTSITLSSSTCVNTHTPVSSLLSLHDHLLSFSEHVVEASKGYNQKQIVTFYIGTPFQSVRLKLSTAICGFWVLDKDVFGHGYSMSESDSIVDLVFEGKLDYTRGKMVGDIIKFATLESNDKIPFLLVNEVAFNDKIDATFDGLIGFGYQCKSKSIGNRNIVPILTANNPEYRDVMVFEYNQTSQTGRITVGDLPDTMDITSKQLYYVPLDRSVMSGHWEIYLRSIYFDDYSMIKVKENISVGIGGYLFSVRKVMFDLIVEKYFQTAITRGECELVKEEVFEIYCNENYDVKRFTRVNLVLGKFTWKIQPESFFMKVTRNGTQRMWFAVVYYPEQDKYYISQLLFSGNNAVVYDREKHRLGLYKGGKIKEE